MARRRPRRDCRTLSTCGTSGGKRVLILLETPPATPDTARTGVTMPTGMGTEVSGMRVANRPPRLATGSEMVFRTRWWATVPAWRAKHPPQKTAQLREEWPPAGRCRARRATRNVGTRGPAEAASDDLERGNAGFSDDPKSRALTDAERDWRTHPLGCKCVDCVYGPAPRSTI